MLAMKNSLRKLATPVTVLGLAAALSGCIEIPPPPQAEAPAAAPIQGPLSVQPAPAKKPRGIPEPDDDTGGGGGGGSSWS